MTHFMNQRNAIVTDAIDGLLATSPPGLARLDGFPNVKVIVRADWDRSKVALVSGGGSGHEPAHAGFVGRGGLTAAVCGEIFASPTVDAVYAAILTVTGEEGCLLIVKNYSGDRLNFGLAAERARAAGLKVEMVIVADDIALEDFAQPRGIAGTLFVHKIAGSAAESGANLETVAAIATRVARTAKSLGIATTTCSIPGQTGHVRLGAGQAELGLGIHGEPGVERIDLPSARAVAELMAKRLGRFVPPSGALALLINNLGGAPDLEMAVFAKSMLETPLGARAQLVVGPARLMTALDMKGVSISVLPVDRELVDALMSECDAPAWPSVGGTRKIEILASAARDRGDEEIGTDNPQARAMLEAICQALLEREAELNALDARVGDGDTGTTFATAARTILAAVDALPLSDAARMCKALAERLSGSMGGSSGVLLSILAAATGHALGTGMQWPSALRAGTERMKFYGGANRGDRTMLDALLPAIEILEAGGDLLAAADAARSGATATAGMTKAGAGRSSYLASRDLAGVADPGAVAVAAAFEAAAGHPRNVERLSPARGASQ
jgi:triose/dihydroxyacetone kinase / FAD-AMP lyase (cyclizing)